MKLLPIIVLAAIAIILNLFPACSEQKYDPHNDPKSPTYDPPYSMTGGNS